MGGILALAVAFGIIFGARKFCDLIGAPLWFAKFLFICVTLVGSYFLAEAAIPYYNKPWGVWIAAPCVASGIILVGFFLLRLMEQEDDWKARSDRSRHFFCSSIRNRSTISSQRWRWLKRTPNSINRGRQSFKSSQWGLGWFANGIIDMIYRSGWQGCRESNHRLFDHG